MRLDAERDTAALGFAVLHHEGLRHAAFGRVALERLRRHDEGARQPAHAHDGAREEAADERRVPWHLHRDLERARALVDDRRDAREPALRRAAGDRVDLHLDGGPEPRLAELR